MEVKIMRYDNLSIEELKIEIQRLRETKEIKRIQLYQRMGFNIFIASFIPYFIIGIIIYIFGMENIYFDNSVNGARIFPSFGT